ncbi:hypothetical protein ACM66B_005262 [Microbotryomycetes sp. NB124-2]
MQRRLPPLSSTSPSEWQYVAEGGANLVLSHRVAHEPDSSSLTARTPFDGLLIRVRKRKLAQTDNKNELETSAVYDKVDSSEFAQHVIEPLLNSTRTSSNASPTSLVVTQDQVDVEPGWLNELEEALKKGGQRPPERLGLDKVDDKCDQVVVCEDLVGGSNVVSVEIKPKWGFLPSPKYLSDSTRDTKTTYCRFCMHRYTKEAHKHPMQALDRHQTGYCPLDLYSQDTGRVDKAVKALWDGWETSHGSANNLRIFVDGKRVEPHDDPGLARLRTLLLMSKTHEAPASTLDLFSTVLTRALMDSPALSVLKHLQQSLDPYDAEGLASVSSLGLAQGRLSEKLSAQPTLDEWKTWLERHVKQAETRKLETLQSDEELQRDALLAYLMSATFKDCSMIARFQYPDPSIVNQPSSPITSSSIDARPPSSPPTSRVPQQPQTTIKLIDLDPKPVSKIPQYLKLDQEIVGTWQTMLKGLEGQECRVRKCSGV